MFPCPVLNFFVSRVQFKIQNQNPANPHEIKENEETSFGVQTLGVQIAKDVSDGGDGGIRTHVALITPKRFRVVLVMTTSIRLHVSPEIGERYPCDSF